ncbi:MAG: Hsp33 family molecular chaperone HslO [Clostridiaceae bacterium]|nr:Hsp33 family molecular chaperone HslO [Clostridiaceae bacterium]
MKDYIVRATAEGSTVRAVAAVTTNLVREAQTIHNLSPVASAALGRTMTAAALMSTFLKGSKDTITIQVKGDGPLGGIVVISDSDSNIRGYVNNPQIYLPLNEIGKLDVATAVGRNGYLNVIKDLGLKEPYIGYVDLLSGEIGEDIAYYYAYSEQIPSVVALGVLVDKNETILNSGGFLIQLMPGAGEDVVSKIEEKTAALQPITTLLRNGKTPEDILGMIFDEKSLKLGEKTECQYQCNCSRERMERNIMSLGRSEIKSMADEMHGAQTQCHFCNMKYQFSEDDLLSMLRDE